MQVQRMMLTAAIAVATTVSSWAQAYETVPNDPINTKIATLSNGMKVYMSVHKDMPRIQTLIATRAGSKNDPADATGLAHYLEHMLFKGNSTFGTRDWDKEKVQLKVISDLYETRRTTKDEAKRKALYHQIDSVSQVAAGFAIANEYDKMMSNIGAQGTNAFTSFEQTVYIEDIPANELERWAKVEGNRFQELTLRLFHTELEAVYEEFNIGQAYDGNRVWEMLFKELFPTHTYGTQTTIGTGEHLKNPSMLKIHEFFDTYYKPNNMAIILAGDFDPDKTVATLEKYFGVWKTKPVPKWKVVPQAAFTKPVVKEVSGPEAPSITLGYRLAGAGSDDAIKLELLKGILNNGQAGLFDLNLIQQQKVLSVSAYPMVLHDYSAFLVEAKPREGQTLEQLRDVVLGQIELVKQGKFEDWLIDATIKNLKVQDIKRAEDNQGRAFSMLEGFILEQPWKDVTNKYNRMAKITKKELMAFATKNFNQNYVLINKKQGEATDLYKVDKPAITPVPLDKTSVSTFKAEFDKLGAKDIEPQFIDFKKDLNSAKLTSGVTFDYIKNPDNPTFQLYYTVDMGQGSDKKLPIAVKLLPYLGTDKYSAKQMQQEFFKLGLTLSVFSNEDRTFVSLQGLEESLPKGIELFEHLLANAKPDAKALEGVVKDIIKEREDATKDKGTLSYRLMTYAKFGKDSPQTDILSADELKKLKAEDLVKDIKNMTAYQHKVFYYGTRTPEEANSIVSKYHTSKGTKPVATPKVYTEQENPATNVYVLNFPDMPQAEVYLISKGGKFDKETAAKSAYYNQYFGGDMSSVVFQEIREARALAYSTWARYSAPRRADRSFYMQAYVGTQADKLKDAVTAITGLINEMPVTPQRIDDAKNSLIKQMRNDRSTKADIYWQIVNDRRMGYDHDSRQDTYEAIQKMSQADLLQFQKDFVKDKKYNIMVLGEKSKLDMKYLETLGKVTELSIQDVSGYEARP